MGDQNKNPVVRMDQHFDIDATLDEVANERFAMPPPVIAAFRQAAMHGVSHLLKLVQNEEAFSKMAPAAQLKVLELVFDRAYGKSETASTSMVALHKTGVTRSSDHGKQLEQMEERMAKANRQFPELQRARQARLRAVKSVRADAEETDSSGDNSPSEVCGGRGELPPVHSNHGPRNATEGRNASSEQTGSTPRTQEGKTKITRLNSLLKGDDGSADLPNVLPWSKNRYGS